jgi:hypothetical protein
LATLTFGAGFFRRDFLTTVIVAAVFSEIGFREAGLLAAVFAAAL